MATKRPENPYDGFISALFKDASEAIKDTAKKTQPEGAAEGSVSIIPGIGPGITPGTEKQLETDTVNLLENRAGIQTADQTEEVSQDRVVLRTLELVSSREHSLVDGRTDIGVSLPTNDGNGGGEKEKSAKDHTQDHTEYQTKDHTGYHTGYHTPSGFEIYPLTEFQRKVLIFLVEKEKKITAMREIAANTGVSYNTIRKILRILFSNGLIIREKGKFVSGKFQGFRYTVREAECKKALEDHTGYQTEYHTEGQTTEGNPVACEIKDASAVVQQFVAHFPEIYPNLHALGVRRKDIVEIVQCWKTQCYDIAKLTDSFEAADWDLAHNDDGHIQIPATYVRKALKSGPYSFPKGFKSRRRIQAEQEAQLAEDCRKFLEKTIEDCFYIWWTGMAPADRQKTDAEIAKINKIMPNLGDVQKNILRQEWFRENVYCEEIKKKLLAK